MALRPPVQWHAPLIACHHLNRRILVCRQQRLRLLSRSVWQQRHGWLVCQRPAHVRPAKGLELQSEEKKKCCGSNGVGLSVWVSVGVGLRVWVLLVPAHTRVSNVRLRTVQESAFVSVVIVKKR